VLQGDLAAIDTLDVPEPYDVFDPTELLELPEADGAALHHRRRHGRVGAEHHLVLLEQSVHAVHRIGRDHRLELEDDRCEGACAPGLEERPVQDPGVTRTDPGDVAGIGASIEEPADGIQRGLAPADDHVARRGVVQRGELADRDTARPVRDFERCGIGGRHARRHVRRVDDAAADGHFGRPTGDARAEASASQVVGHREEANAARRQEAMAHDLVEVAADLGPAGALVEVDAPVVGLDPAVSQRGRADPVVARRLVELHERVRVQPMTARSMAPLDHHDIGITVLDHAVDERHPERAGTDDEVVRLELRVPVHPRTQ